MCRLGIEPRKDPQHLKFVYKQKHRSDCSDTVLMLLPDCPLRWDSVFHHASVSPSREAGYLLRFLVSADLKFPHCPSAQRAQHLSEHSPFMHLVYRKQARITVPRRTFNRAHLGKNERQCSCAVPGKSLINRVLINRLEAALNQCVRKRNVSVRRTSFNFRAAIRPEEAGQDPCQDFP
jgi:hypothetical protein